MSTTYVKLDGQQIVAVLKTDQDPTDAVWINVGTWVGYKERPGEGYKPFLINGVISWKDTRTDSDFWEIVRTKRNSLLAESDWLVTRAIETGDPMPIGWATYRQELRNVTTQADPREVIWPDQPA